MVVTTSYPPTCYVSGKHETLRSRTRFKKIYPPPPQMQTTCRGVICTDRKSFERNTVQGQTGVPVQDRGGGGTVGSDSAEKWKALLKPQKFTQVPTGSSNVQWAKPCTAVCKQSVKAKKQKAQPVKVGLDAWFTWGG
jgi:hypothetical protein